MLILARGASICGSPLLFTPQCLIVPSFLLIMHMEHTFSLSLWPPKKNNPPLFYLECVQGKTPGGIIR